MATYIPIDDDLPDHHKTARLAGLLGCPRTCAMGHLVLLWLYVMRVAWRDGDLSAYPIEPIEKACDWHGEPGGLIKGLQECGRPLEDGKKRGPGLLVGLVVHDWAARSSRLIRDRLYREERRSGTVNEVTVEGTEICDAWNAFAKQHGLIHCARPPKLPESMTPAKFKLLLDAAAKQPFLLGNGDKGWRIDLYWLLRAGNADKVLGMQYAQAEGKGAPPIEAEPDYRRRTREILASRKGKTE